MCPLMGDITEVLDASIWDPKHIQAETSFMKLKELF